MEALQLLFDVEQYKGYVYVGCKSKNGFSEMCSRRIDRIDNFVSSSMKQYKTVDYYITANSMKTATERNNAAVFALNNVVIDIDVHERMNANERKSLIDEFVYRFKRDITIPLPNVIHYTGRGLQMWWHLEQAAAVLSFLYARIVERIEYVINALLEEYPSLQSMEIDKTASGNLCGYYRLFGTTNTHTKEATQWEILHKQAYNISDLFAVLETNDDVQEELHKIEIEKKKHAPQIMCVKTSYIALQRKRLNMIEWIAEHRQYECTGLRDIMLFLYYNAAIQLYQPNAAKELTEALNDKFKEPLGSIDYIYKLFERNNKFYRFKNSTFDDWLHITDKEKEAFQAEHITQNATRAQQREAHKLDKNKRKQLVYDLLQTGKYTLDDIAEATQLSIATVKRMSATADKPTPDAQSKPWEALGVSRATYYRQKKQGK